MCAELSIGEKRRYLRKHVHLLTRADKIEIGEIFIKFGLSSSIKECSDGCYINLRDVDENIISQLYSTMHHKINKIV